MNKNKPIDVCFDGFEPVLTQKMQFRIFQKFKKFQKTKN